MPRLTTGFATPQESARATSLRSWTSAQMARLAQQVHGAHLDWCQRWGLPAPMCEDVLVREASVSPAHAAFEALDEATYSELFADHSQCSPANRSNDSMATALARHASESWRREVGIGFAVTQCGAEAPSPAQQAWDGRLDVLLSIGKAKLHFVVDANEIQRRLSDAPIESLSPSPRGHSRGAPESVVQALRAQPVHLGVHLEPATLTLGELAALQPGDVIPLQHALSDPLKIHAPDGSLLSGAWLGQADGHVAVRLHGTPHTSSPFQASASP